MLQFLIHTIAKLFSKDKSPEAFSRLDSELEKDITGVRKELWLIAGGVMIFVILIIWFSSRNS